MAEVEYLGDEVPHRRSSSLSEADVKMIARQAGRAAAEEAWPRLLTQLGVDISTPQAIMEMQADNQWIRRTRKSSENAGKQIKNVGIGAAVIFFLTIMGLGLRAWLKQNGVSPE